MLFFRFFLFRFGNQTFAKQYHRDIEYRADEQRPTEGRTFHDENYAPARPNHADNQ